MDQASDETLSEQYPSFAHSAVIAGRWRLSSPLQMGRAAKIDGCIVTAAPLRNTRRIDRRHRTPAGRDRAQARPEVAGRTQPALQQAYAQMEQRVQERTEELSRQLSFMHQLIEAIPSPLFYGRDAQARYLG